MRLNVYICLPNQLVSILLLFKSSADSVFGFSGYAKETRLLGQILQIINDQIKGCKQGQIKGTYFD